jgi:hypothetical protein
LRFDPELHGQQGIIFTRMYPTLERRTTLLSIEVPANISSRRWAQRTLKQVEPGHTPILEWFKVALEKYREGVEFFRTAMPGAQVVTVDGTQPTSVIRTEIQRLISTREWECT